MIIKEFTQIGKRQNNEDSYGYNNNLATVCDGMGGHVCGEMASGFIVKELLKYFDNPVEDLNKERIQNELDKAQQGLNKILDEKPELEKMGTTLQAFFSRRTFGMPLISATAASICSALRNISCGIHGTSRWLASLCAITRLPVKQDAIIPCRTVSPMPSWPMQRQGGNGIYRENQPVARRRHFPALFRWRG